MNYMGGYMASPLWSYMRLQPIMLTHFYIVREEGLPNLKDLQLLCVKNTVGA